MISTEALHNVLHANEVERYHACPGVPNHSLGAHQAGVAQILLYIWPEAPGHVVMNALCHDAAEVFTGDVSFLVKRKFPSVKAALQEAEDAWWMAKGGLPPMGTGEYMVLKAADYLEGMWWCARAMRAGNEDARPVFEAFYAGLKENPLFEAEAPHPTLDRIGKVLEVILAEAPGPAA